MINSKLLFSFLLGVTDYKEKWGIAREKGMHETKWPNDQDRKMSNLQNFKLKSVHNMGQVKTENTHMSDKNKTNVSNATINVIPTEKCLLM